jgi:D-sedoheptulose 7-phosphate isomerase
VFWAQYQVDLAEAMRGLVPTASLRALAVLAAHIRRLHFYGNGASATMASHMATDWTRRGQLNAWAYTDPAWLTATGNDAGYERVFADTLRLTAPKDLVCCISSSGKSPNILTLAKEAKAANRTVITLSGLSPDNPLRALGHVNVYVPSQRYGIVETVHAAYLHAWLDTYCEIFLDKPAPSDQSFSTS